MAEISKEHIATVFDSIARMLELKGENVFKVRAYLNAAKAIETYPGDLATAVGEGKLHEVKGIGDAIAAKVSELVMTGQLSYYEILKAEFPPGLFELFELQGLGPKKIKAVWENLGITNVPMLEAGCQDGSVAALPGFGAKTATNILASIEARKKHAGRFRLGDIAAEAERLYADLRDHPDALRVSVCGSYRRRKEVVGDLDYLISTKNPEALSEFFTSHEMVESILAKGATKSSVRLKNGIQADLRVVKDSEFTFALNYFTGSKEHNIIMRQRALARGWTLNEYRLGVDEKARVAATEPIPAIREEADLYRALGLDYIEPELREDRGEFTASENRRLPDLIKVENLRGAFHCHTTESDGRNSLEEMAAAAQDLGMQYLGIADHSQSSVQARGLDEKRLKAQMARIRELNQGYEGFRIFSGSEVDVLKDGSLDFPDELLAQLDYTVASVHAVFNLPEAEMTKRVIKAISNPHVTMLGHLTGRLLLQREPYALDVPAVIEAAAATGTIIELNCSPWRMEMDWRWWPLAVEKGVKCSINPDAHRTSHLQFVYFGVGTARKGWLTRRDVVNTLPLGEIEEVLSAKRKRHGLA